MSIGWRSVRCHEPFDRESNTSCYYRCYRNGRRICSPLCTTKPLHRAYNGYRAQKCRFLTSKGKRSSPSKFCGLLGTQGRIVGSERSNLLSRRVVAAGTLCLVAQVSAIFWYNTVVALLLSIPFIILAWEFLDHPIYFISAVIISMAWNSYNRRTKKL